MARATDTTDRALHVLDLENLVGGPFATAAEVRAAVDEYAARMGIGPDDHVIGAMCTYAWKRVVFGLPDGWRILNAGAGRDAADRMLIDECEPAWVARRFDRVVIGSGDGRFAWLAHALRRAGCHTTVVSREGSLAASLRRAADEVRVLPALAA